MGLTIHYQFSLNNASLTEARDKIIALRNFALQLPFARVEELTELQGEASHEEQGNVNDPHMFLKIRRRFRKNGIRFHLSTNF